jgi:hypothetical protein
LHAGNNVHIKFILENLKGRDFLKGFTHRWENTIKMELYVMKILIGFNRLRVDCDDSNEYPSSVITGKLKEVTVPRILPVILLDECEELNMSQK